MSILHQYRILIIFDVQQEWTWIIFNNYVVKSDVYKTEIHQNIIDYNNDSINNIWA